MERGSHYDLLLLDLTHYRIFGTPHSGTNEVIHDISSIMRPNLRSGYMHAQGKGRGAPGTQGRVQRRFSHASGMWKDVKGHAVNAGGSSLHLSADVPREMDTSEQLQHIFRYYCTFGRTGGDGTVGVLPRAFSGPALLASCYLVLRHAATLLLSFSCRSWRKYFPKLTKHATQAQQTLDNSNFAKFSRECPGLLDRRLNKTEVDLIFTKAKPKFKRRLDFSHFLDALTAMANKKYPQYDAATAL